VLPDYRNRGLGRLLMKVIAQYAVAQNFPYVKWDMMDWNAAGRRFYEGIGAEFDPGYTICRWRGQALLDFAK
jgi:GNAT superfamily N-acetyltransferase